jgi:hypothetical protein
LAALPGPMRAGLRVQAGGGSVAVRVSVPRVIPGFDLALSADAELVSQ